MGAEQGETAMTGAAVADLDGLFRRERALVWGLCYRVTGSAADADDLVQETFVRAMERPPQRLEAPLRPWLMRIAVNLGRDLLRRRRRRRYPGPWLPSPLETDEGMLPSYEIADPARNTEGRYELLESISYAFLLALEALTPNQRAVLVLRDVFDYSVAETAVALDLSEPNVKTVHYRARAAMRDYDRRRCLPTRELAARTREILSQLVVGLTSHDVSTVADLLAEDVRSLSDGGHEYAAARKPVCGRDRVLRLFRKLAEKSAVTSMESRTVNGLPALVLEFGHSHPRYAPRLVLRCELGADSRITELHTILAPSKLTGVRAARMVPNDATFDMSVRSRDDSRTTGIPAKSGRQLRSGMRSGTPT
jgi:RNA polymerase sigma-70 factor (ECF subfamily)